jgi:hypothetical protein
MRAFLGPKPVFLSASPSSRKENQKKIRSKKNKEKGGGRAGAIFLIFLLILWTF